MLILQTSDNTGQVKYSVDQEERGYHHPDFPAFIMPIIPSLQ